MSGQRLMNMRRSKRDEREGASSKMRHHGELIIAAQFFNFVLVVNSRYEMM